METFFFFYAWCLFVVALPKIELLLCLLFVGLYFVRIKFKKNNPLIKVKWYSNVEKMQMFNFGVNPGIFIWFANAAKIINIILNCPEKFCIYL